MSDEPKKKRRFPAVIDLTSRGQEAAKLATNPPPAAEEHTDTDEGLDTSLASLPETIQAAVRSAGWDRLMPVQARTLPYMTEGRDLIVQSKTGSGKTGAFLLPLFASLNPARRGAQALVLTPTRELAKQIHDEFVRLKGDRKEAEGLDAVLVYGGVGYGEQTAGLKGGAQLVIGTPGRILDHLERRTLSLDGLKTLVLDEADEMLSMGFLPAMNKLRRYLPDARQSTMFSATMPPLVRRLAETFLTEPAHLSLAGGSVQVDALAHRYYVVPGMGKDRTLVRLIELENPETAILFANTKREVEYLAQFLRNYGHDAGELSGDLNQGAREAIMQRLRDGNLRFLVATDVAARGIDISDLSHVIQYDVPQDPEYYVHRAGRTARAGKTGVSITLTSEEDKNKLLAIARRYDLDFEERPLPTDEEVAERVRERLTTLLEDRYREMRTLARERAARFDPLVVELAAEEPHLLSLLLDGLYHESLHAQPQEELNTLAARRAQERREREWDDDGRRGGRRGSRPSERPSPRDERRNGPRDDRRDEPREESRDEPREESRAERHDDAPTSGRRARTDTTEPERARRPERMDDRADDGFSETQVDRAEEAPRDRAESGSEDERTRRRKKRRRGDRPDDTRDAAAQEPARPEGERVSDDGQDEARAFEAAWQEPETPAVLDVSSAALDALAPDEAAPAPDRSRRRGRGRRGATSVQDVSPRDGDEAEDGPDAALRAETTASTSGTNRAETTSSNDAAPSAAGEHETGPVPGEPSPVKAERAPRAKKPAGPFSVFELRAMPDEALRALGADLLDEVPEERSDLLYAVLDAQAVRESAGRGRRTKEAAPSRGRRGDRREGDRREGDRREGDRRSAKAEPSRKETPKPAARPEPPKPSGAKDAAAEPSSRRKRRRRKSDAAPLVPLAGTGAATLPPPPPMPAAAVSTVEDDASRPASSEAPKRSRGRRTSEAPKAAPEAADAPPTAEESEAPRARRTRARKADASAETTADPAPTTGEAEATSAPRKASRKRAAPAAEPTSNDVAPIVSAEEAPKRSRSRKAVGADEASAPAEASEAAPAPKRTRARKVQPSDADTPDATTAPAPKRTRARNTADDVPTPEGEAPAPKRSRARTASAPDDASDIDTPPRRTRGATSTE